MSQPRIYLDHAATTPMLPAAKAAVIEAMERWANPSSPHREGRAARAALEDARDRIKAALGWKHELIFTSGASEAAAIALGRAKARTFAVSAVEHPAVAKQRSDATILPVDTTGLVQLGDIAPGTLVAVQQINSETGVIQPLDWIVEAMRAAGATLFADCAQGAGKLGLPDADLIALSAHKFGGPPGIGALLVRDLASLEPLGQGQEQGYRPGTENLPGAMGFAAAIETIIAKPGWIEACGDWRTSLDAAVREHGGEVIADGASRLPLIASYRLPGTSAAAQLMRFDAMGIAVSAGSACSSGTMKASPVLAALGITGKPAEEVIRVSFGHSTTADEVARFAEAWTTLARESAARAA